MRALVLGGTQFIGREVVARLLARGHQVTVLHRREGHDLGTAVGNLQADRADLPRLARLLGEHAFEAIVDLAYDWERGTPAEQVEAAARAAAAGPLRRYVYVSSIAAYGSGLDRREEDPLAAADHPAPYTRHKAGAERALFRLYAESGFPVTTVRPPFVHGPRQPFYREQFFWDRLDDGRPIVLPDGGGDLMHLVDVADVAEACVRALEAPEAVGQAFNVGHREPLSQRAYVEALARVAGIEPKLVPMSRAAIRAAGGRLAGGNLYFGEYMDLPPMTLAIGKAERLLGLVPAEFEESLRRGYAWYRSEPRRGVDYTFEDRLLARD